MMSHSLLPTLATPPQNHKLYSNFGPPFGNGNIFNPRHHGPWIFDTIKKLLNIGRKTFAMDKVENNHYFLDTMVGYDYRPFKKPYG